MEKYEKIYAVDLNDNAYLEDNELKLLNFIYLHGNLYKDNVKDFAYEYIKGGVQIPDGVKRVDVVYPDGTEVPAWLYIWTTLNQFEWCENCYANDAYPIEVNNAQRKGLVCAVDDTKANQEAIAL